MHEYPLTLNIIETVSAKAGGSKVKRINLVIGESSGILGDSIRLYFNEIAIGTSCEGAKIEITPVKAMLRCNTCGKLFHRKPFSFTCDGKDCDGEGLPTEIGREFYIKSIDV